jgi:hypothetical protein
MAAFCGAFSGYGAHSVERDRIVELRADGAGTTLPLHRVGTGRKQGQTLVKLVFGWADVAGFCKDARAKGLEFGPLHRADGYVFANVTDPSGNSVSVSGRLAQG